jgi:hypothetical protein
VVPLQQEYQFGGDDVLALDIVAIRLTISALGIHVAQYQQLTLQTCGRIQRWGAECQGRIKRSSAIGYVVVDL